MVTVNDLHPQAMDLAESAFRQRRRGNEQKAKELFLEALQLERQAAAILPPTHESEPSRSILYRSAASLAYNGGDFEAADWLIANGLAGFPPPEIKDELKNLYEDVNFMRHLSAKGLELDHRQWLMTMSGNATSHGKAAAEQLLMRVDKVTTIFYRTVERLLKLPYRTNGGVSKEIKDQYGLFVDAFLPSSFAVAFQIGSPNPQLNMFPEYPTPQLKIEPATIIDEVMKCFEILEGQFPETLRERIEDQTYYDNFVGLAKQISPDGDEIKLVGFTTIRDGQEKPLALRKVRQQLRSSLSSEQDKDDSSAPEQKQFKGLLMFANTPTRGKFGRVKLRDAASGKEYMINVPIGLMKDVVQPFYEENVIVLTHQQNDKIYLDEISRSLD